MNSYLKLAKQTINSFLASEPKLKIKLVIGNQSGDLDSITSAIAYGFYDTCLKAGNVTPTIPVLNFESRDLKLRKDVQYLFDKFSIDIKNLCFIDEFQHLSPLQKRQTDLILVDHNKIESNIEKYLFVDQTQIKAIIDHHKDENLYLDCYPRIIHTTGSCSTLVQDFWLGEKLLAKVEAEELLAAAVLVDTSYLKYKVTEEDQKIFKHYTDTVKGIDWNDFYSNLRKAKSNIDDLSLIEIFRKDLKSYEYSPSDINGLYDSIGKAAPDRVAAISIGIASMVKSVEWLAERFSETEIINLVFDFCSSMGLEALILMSNYAQNSEFHRQLVIFSNKDNSLVADALTQDLLKSNLELLPAFTLAGTTVYNQLNVKASRKQVAPLVSGCFSRGSSCRS